MNKKYKRQYVIKSEKGDHLFIANSKRGLVGLLATVVDNNLIDLKNQSIEIWDKEELEKVSGIII